MGPHGGCGHAIELFDLLLDQPITLQIQRQQLAQVQADFAFGVIDPPVAPDKPHTPKVALSSAVAAALAFFGCLGAILMRERMSHSLHEYQRRGRATARASDEVPLRKAEELSTHLPRKQTV